VGTQELNRTDNRVAKAWLVALAIFSLGLFLVPAFIIRPFTHQSAIGLRLALFVKWIAPTLTLLALLVVLAVAWSLWQRSPWLLRSGIIASLLLCLASAVMVRQNYFEWMFNPIKAARFVAPGDSHLDDKEMVMTLKIGQEARAYPIVQMAYHHILNDTVAGEPIVVTY
jgi:Protein of unknown function (DUF3179)